MQMSVRQAIADGGAIRDEASEELSRVRSKMRIIENRLRNLLKGMPGEMSEQVDCSLSRTAC